MTRFAAGIRARGICDRCGFEYKLNDLKYEMQRGVRTNLRVCDTCFDEDHPQNFLGEYPVVDAEALRDPRPDFSDDS